MRELQQHEVISGKKGRAYLQIDGNNVELFYAKSVEASIEKNKAEIKTIGSAMSGHKTISMKGSGSMTLFYLSPIFRKKAAEYMETGKDLYFNMLVENDDEESGAGKQSVLLTGVNIDSLILTKLDGESDDALDEEVNFTFNGFKFLEHFKEIN